MSQVTLFTTTELPLPILPMLEQLVNFATTTQVPAVVNTFQCS